MTLTQTVAALCLTAAVAVVVAVAARRPDAPPVRRLAPAVLVLFVGWTAYAVADGGPLGFWPVHASTPWGVQVWADLLVALAVGWTAVRPRLAAAGLSPWPWAVLLLATGSIGLLAALVTLHAVEARTARQTLKRNSTTSPSAMT